MDSFEVNKILGAVLGTALLFMVIGTVADAAFHKEHLETNAYPVDVPEAAHGGEAGGEEEAFDLGTVLASGDPAKGERSGRGKCGACHTFERGGPNSTGPDLWEVVGRQVASHEGFTYSSGMQAFGGEWTYERLWSFLGNPRDTVKGTAMSFIGLPRESERADVIAWLRTLSDSPEPLPEPAAPAHEEAPPAEEGAAPAEDAPAEEAAPAGEAAPAEPAPAEEPAGH